MYALQCLTGVNVPFHKIAINLIVCIVEILLCVGSVNIFYSTHFRVMASVLQLGFITLFLSDALVSSYICAASFVILIAQMRFILGLDPKDSKVDPGLFATPRVSCAVVDCGVNFYKEKC